MTFIEINMMYVHVLINRVDLTPKNVFVFTNIKFVKFYKLCNSNVGVFCIRISDDILLWICAIYAVCNQDKKGCNKSIGLSLQNLNHYLTHFASGKTQENFPPKKRKFSLFLALYSYTWPSACYLVWDGLNECSPFSRFVCINLPLRKESNFLLGQTWPSPC